MPPHPDQPAMGRASKARGPMASFGGWRRALPEAYLPGSPAVCLGGKAYMPAPRPPAVASVGLSEALCRNPFSELGGRRGA